MLLLQFLNGREALAAGAEELGEMELGTWKTELGETELG